MFVILIVRGTHHLVEKIFDISQRKKKDQEINFLYRDDDV